MPGAGAQPARGPVLLCSLLSAPLIQLPPAPPHHLVVPELPWAPSFWHPVGTPGRSGSPATPAGSLLLGTPTPSPPLPHRARWRRPGGAVPLGRRGIRSWEDLGQEGELPEEGAWKEPILPAHPAGIPVPWGAPPSPDGPCEGAGATSQPCPLAGRRQWLGPPPLPSSAPHGWARQSPPAQGRRGAREGAGAAGGARSGVRGERERGESAPDSQACAPLGATGSPRAARAPASQALSAGAGAAAPGPEEPWGLVFGGSRESAHPPVSASPERSRLARTGSALPGWTARPLCLSRPPLGGSLYSVPA